MMEIKLYGGFGEKGRLGAGLAAGQTRLLFDIGIKVGATGRDYYPLIEADDIAALDAVLLSHAHEDHVGGLLWLLEQGFQGRIFMTAATVAETEQTLKNYAEQHHLVRVALPRQRISLFEAGDILTIKDARIATGRSGHVAGGVWFCTSLEGRRIIYSGDVVPDSPVLKMDAFPQCDLLLLDASYGADPVSGAMRAQQVREWIVKNRDGCLLPTPLSGRSLELLALMASVSGNYAIHADMRAALAGQIAQSDALQDNAAVRLKQFLHQAQDWREDQALPRCPLLTFDAMGRAGPSVYAMNRAVKTGWPVLLTGHVPEDTPAHAMLQDELADWIRLPTHPTLSGMVELWEQAGRPVLYGHSCSAQLLAELKEHIAAVQQNAKSGDIINLGAV
ncbi:MBL fold metallo-hydrolase [Pseudochrobactrum sp. HB0163]|uniref:MBL fold metallo-hydrolase n=1 Tax=Pseudochrobactrum sp. HB0163 TaxID=3450708 RepID=UPI003F6DF1BB